ncbi:pyridoxal 5'-phosphate synthase [Homoserinibacter sp. GY 40078]|nr:pyridoxal 5'-phosphate synthase [Homoserinibacter sp. GY 40078]
MRAIPPFPAELPSFEPGATPESPGVLFVDWFEQAASAGVLAAQAGVLATNDETGPSARVLTLKDVDIATDAWEVATPADSRPGSAMTTTPRAALTFFWPALGRQVRIEGRVVRASTEESAADFLARPASARAVSLVGRPTPTLTDDAAYEGALAASSQRVIADPTLVPESWALWRIVADSVEFWQASHGRAHTRLRYRRADGDWARERLWP